MSEPARTDPPRRIDVRVGSSTNALQPISGAQRRVGAGLSQWVALLVIVGTANHFVIDAVAGAAVVGVGFGIQYLMSGRPAHVPAPSPAVETDLDEELVER